MKKTLVLVLLIQHISLRAEVLELLPSVYQKTFRSHVLSKKNKTTIRFNLSKLHFKRAQNKKFKSIDIKKSFIPGAATRPFESAIVVGKPGNIFVQVKKGVTKKITHFLLEPAEKELCRCQKESKELFFSSKKYQQEKLVTKKYLGDFRGTPLTLVTLYASLSDLKTKSTTFFPEIEVEIKARRYQIEPLGNKRYLIVFADSLEESAKEFSYWKEAQGFEVVLKKLSDFNNDLNTVKDFIKNDYENNQLAYTVFVGAQNLFETFKVKTSSDDKTPSDYPHFIMGGEDDSIPDIFYGRLVANTNEEVLRQLEKMEAYKTRYFDNGYYRGIGIASNEGSHPSDNEYIKSIQQKFESSYEMSYTHFFQDDSDSRAEKINEAFQKGASWLTYMGHGDGVAWSSTNIPYDTGDIKEMDNAKATKPIFIDVACQNGKLLKGHAGERLMNEVDDHGQSLGATLYYGGSVNISWHPPAIMARGIAYKKVDENIEEIGSAIWAGQLYLAENYDHLASVQENFKWYHLFGDPSLKIQLK